MKLTVLGCNGPYPKVGGACSGYLIEHHGIKVLLDCGNGVLSNIQKICKIEELDAIFLTHLHPDHISDIFILRYALQYRGKKIKLFAPKNPPEIYGNLEHKSYILEAIDETSKLKFGDLQFEFKEMKHVLPNYAISIKTGNKKMIYSGDTKYTKDLIDFSYNADLLLCEAGVLDKDLKNNPPHLSAKQAIEMAKESGVNRILLTHFFPEYSIEDYKREVKDDIYWVEFAEILSTYEI